MGKKKGANTTSGEQMALIDVTPENLKQIEPIARRYRAAMKTRVAALKDEVEAKQKILALVKDAHLTRLEDGTIRFKCEGKLIIITPRDEKITIKDEKKGDEDEA